MKASLDAILKLQKDLNEAQDLIREIVFAIASDVARERAKHGLSAPHLPGWTDFHVNFNDVTVCWETREPGMNDTGAITIPRSVFEHRNGMRHYIEHIIPSELHQQDYDALVDQKKDLETRIKKTEADGKKYEADWEQIDAQLQKMEK